MIRLLTLLERTLVLELQAARLRGLLEGKTPQARFDSFTKQLKPSLLEDYPGTWRVSAGPISNSGRRRGVTFSNTPNVSAP